MILYPENREQERGDEIVQTSSGKIHEFTWIVPFSRLTSRFKQHFSTDSNFTRKLPPLAGHMHVHVTLLAHDQLDNYEIHDPVRRPLRIPLILQ